MTGLLRLEKLIMTKTVEKMKWSLTPDKIKKCIKRKLRHNLLPDSRIGKLCWGIEESWVITYWHGKSENNVSNTFAGGYQYKHKKCLWIKGEVAICVEEGWCWYAVFWIK